MRARSRSSLLWPQPEGPSSVKSSPSATVRSTRSTAVTAPKRLVTPWISMIMPGGAAPPLLLQLVPPGLDLGAEPGLERLRPLGRHRLVVDVGHVGLEVRAHPAGELDRELRGRARRALHLVLRGDREEPALHEYLLAALGQEELDEGTRRLRIARPREDRHGLGGDEGVPRRHELDVEAGQLLLEGHVG